MIGPNSYLASHFLREDLSPVSVSTFSHDEIHSIPSQGYEAVINFACDPDYHVKPYDVSFDFDAQLAEKISGREIHYIFLSSRKVYWPQFDIDENVEPSGQGDYGRNMVITENLIRRLFPNSHTIIRIGNIIGHDMKPHTFIGEATRSLKRENKIFLDIGLETRRDFLPATDFARALSRILMKRPLGTFNLASGIATPVGDIANWVVEGYKKGCVVCSTDDITDAFTLDVKRLEAIIGPITSEDAIKKTCLEIGEQLIDG